LTYVYLKEMGLKDLNLIIHSPSPFKIGLRWP